MAERMPLPRIMSARNPRLQRIRRLYRKNARLHEGCYVVDTPRDLERALAAGYALEYVLICEELIDPESDVLAALPAKCSHAVSAKLLARVGYRQNPSGLLAVLRSPTPPVWDERTAEVPLLLAMVGLRVPGNIGALLRSADALGVRTSLLVDSPLDLYNPNLIRNSTGACFLQNLIPLSTEAAIARMREAGFALVAAAVDGERSIYNTELPEKLAIVLGEEHAGLDERWLTAADMRLRVPAAGEAVDSLNVAACGAVMMYEARRQQHARLDRER